MRKGLLASLLFFFSIPMAGTGIEQSPTSSANSQAGDFPATLLEGVPKFGMVVFYQGDLRGNFGPCG